MKKNMKKIFAVLLAAIMVMASGVTVFADGTTSTKPTASDKATITVTDVKTDATVNAYQIVKAKYNGNGFTGYELVEDVKNATDKSGNPLNLTIADFEEPTAAEITAIAQAIEDGDLTLTVIPMAKGQGSNPDTTFTASVGAGEYIVVASGAKDVIYNPMLLSAYYSVSGSDNTMASGTISANDTWTINGTSAHAKSSEPTVTKKITSPAAGTGTNGHGSDAAVGDAIQYQIEADIPAYSHEYTTVDYSITDTLSAGLTPPHVGDVDVKVAGQAPTTAPTVTVNGQTVSITFASAYILDNGGKKVTVTYPATLNENATVNMDSNPNDVTLTYSNDPADHTSHTTKTDRTYVYTFALDGNVNGSVTTQNHKTHELIKVDENGNVTDQEFDETTTDETTVTNALSGATFTLTNDDTHKVYTATTDSNGYFNGFTELDAGTYTLVETKAPDGYSVDDTEHTVVITPTYNGDGTLVSYTITIDGTATSTYTATYGADKVITNIESTSQTTYIKNTTLKKLPSTGGIGTYIFTIIGVALMVIAALLYIRRRRQA